MSELKGGCVRECGWQRATGMSRCMQGVRERSSMKS